MKCRALRPAGQAGAAGTAPAPWHRPQRPGQSGIAAQSETPGHARPCRGRCESKERRCSARRAWAPNQGTEGIYRRLGKKRKSASTRERGAVNTGAKSRAQKQARSTRWDAREKFSGPRNVVGGKPRGSEAAGQKGTEASSDAMGLDALAVRCQREARWCSQRSMDFAAVHHTIAARNGPASFKALSALTPARPFPQHVCKPCQPQPAAPADSIVRQAISPGQWL